MAAEPRLDPAVALEHMGDSPYIGTGLMRIRMPMMLGRRYQPATMKIGIWQKDMQIIGDLARELNCPTPMLGLSGNRKQVLETIERMTPIPGSLVSTLCSRSAALEVPSATTTMPAWIELPIPTPPPWWTLTQVAPDARIYAFDEDYALESIAEAATGVFDGSLTIRRGDFTIGEGPWAAFDIVAAKIIVSAKSTCPSTPWSNP